MIEERQTISQEINKLNFDSELIASQIVEELNSLILMGLDQEKINGLYALINAAKSTEFKKGIVHEKVIPSIEQTLNRKIGFLRNDL